MESAPTEMCYTAKSKFISKNAFLNITADLPTRKTPPYLRGYGGIYFLNSISRN